MLDPCLCPYDSHYPIHLFCHSRSPPSKARRRNSGALFSGPRFSTKYSYRVGDAGSVCKPTMLRGGGTSLRVTACWPTLYASNVPEPNLFAVLRYTDTPPPQNNLTCIPSTICTSRSCLEQETRCLDASSRGLARVCWRGWHEDWGVIEALAVKSRDILALVGLHVDFFGYAPCEPPYSLYATRPPPFYASGLSSLYLPLTKLPRFGAPDVNISVR